MFELNKNLKSLSPKKDDLYELFSSINTPLVAVEGFPTEQSRAYIVTLRESKGAYEISIFLHMLNSNKGVFYSCGKVSEDKYPDIKNSAFDFVETMGFLMERVFHFSDGENLAEESLKTLPMFFNNLEKKGEEEVISLEESDAVIEVKEEAEPAPSVKKVKMPQEELKDIDVLLDEVENEERKVKEESQKKVIGKVQVKSMRVEEKVNILNKFESFFRFLCSF